MGGKMSNAYHANYNLAHADQRAKTVKARRPLPQNRVTHEQPFTPSTTGSATVRAVQ